MSIPSGNSDRGIRCRIDNNIRIKQRMVVCLARKAFEQERNAPAFIPCRNNHRKPVLHRIHHMTLFFKTAEKIPGAEKIQHERSKRAIYKNVKNRIIDRIIHYFQFKKSLQKSQINQLFLFYHFDAIYIVYMELQTEKFEDETRRKDDPVTEAARKSFGISYLYPWQRLVIANILDAAGYSPAVKEEDIAYRGRQIVLLPTGAGKSLCFLI